jgi:hypothetical protein
MEVLKLFCDRFILKIQQDPTIKQNLSNSDDKLRVLTPLITDTLNDMNCDSTLNHDQLLAFGVVICGIFTLTTLTQLPMHKISDTALPMIQESHPQYITELTQFFERVDTQYIKPALD